MSSPKRKRLRFDATCFSLTIRAGMNKESGAVLLVFLYEGGFAT